MQTSVKPSVFLICGHGIHCDCLNKYLQVSTLFQSPDFQNNYICPICQKTIIKADAYFASLDQWVAENPMPEEYQDWTRTIICNDCEKENVVKFNFFYHKVGERRERKLTWQCPNCSSYNTKPIQTFGRNKEVVEQVVCFVCFLIQWIGLFIQFSKFMRLLVALATLLLLGFAHGHKDNFICRNCGKDLASSAFFLEGNSPNSIGYGRDALIPEEYEVFYEEFQPAVRYPYSTSLIVQSSGEVTKLYYMEEIEEQSVSILPEKKKSDRFPGFTYQTIICRICKQPIGYLYSPVDRDVTNMIETRKTLQ